MFVSVVPVWSVVSVACCASGVLVSVDTAEVAFSCFILTFLTVKVACLPFSPEPGRILKFSILNPN